MAISTLDGALGGMQCPQFACKVATPTLVVSALVTTPSFAASTIKFMIN